MIELIIYVVLAAWAFIALLWLIDRVTGFRRRAESEKYWSERRKNRLPSRAEQRWMK